MGKIIFITGGARSGKSSFAEEMALKNAQDVLYIATALAFDREMEERIRIHKERRPANWQTLEAYKNLPERLREFTAGGAVQKGQPPLLLFDCLTVMVTNILMEQEVPDWDKLSREDGALFEKIVEKEVDDFLTFCAGYPEKTLIVSNELGMGLVPPNPLGRYFRDVQGRMNQKVAKKAGEAYFLVSGLPVRLK